MALHGAGDGGAQDLEQESFSFLLCCQRRGQLLQEHCGPHPDVTLPGVCWPWHTPSCETSLGALSWSLVSPTACLQEGQSKMADDFLEILL